MGLLPTQGDEKHAFVTAAQSGSTSVPEEVDFRLRGNDRSA
jgi:hypothetical protein